MTALPPSEAGGDHVTVAEVPLPAGVTTRPVGAVGVPAVAQPVAVTRVGADAAVVGVARGAGRAAADAVDPHVVGAGGQGVRHRGAEPGGAVAADVGRGRVGGRSDRAARSSSSSSLMSRSGLRRGAGRARPSRRRSRCRAGDVSVSAADVITARLGSARRGRRDGAARLVGDDRCAAGGDDRQVVLGAGWRWGTRPCSTARRLLVADAHDRRPHRVAAVVARVAAPRRRRGVPSWLRPKLWPTSWLAASAMSLVSLLARLWPNTHAGWW